MTPEQKAKEYADKESPIKDTAGYVTEYEFNMSLQENKSTERHFLAGYQYAQECRREELEKIIGDAIKQDRRMLRQGGWCVAARLPVPDISSVIKQIEG